MAPLDPRVFSIRRPHLERYTHTMSENIIVETYVSDAGSMRSQGALHRISVNQTAHGRYAFRYDGGAFRTVERPALTLEFQPAGRFYEVEGDGADYISIFQPPRVFRTAGYLEGSLDERRLSAPVDAVTLHLVLALAAASQDDGTADPLMAEHLGIGLARCVIRLLGLRLEPVRETAGLDADRLRRVTDYIEAELVRQDLTVEALAQVAHASMSQFSRSFRRATGISPHQFILGRRVARARQLLKEGRMPLSQVAYVTGFSSQAHFSTVFRKTTGITPRQFRHAYMS